MRFFRFSLITKLSISTSLMLLLFMALFSYISLEALEKLLMEEAASDADKLSETLIKTTHYQMMENDQIRVHQMIQEVGTQSGIEHIRMVNKNGIIIFSTKNNEVGTVLDKSAEACNMCHAGATPLTQVPTMSRSRIFRDRNGREVMGLAKAIYNQKSCSSAACHAHPPSARVLGVLDVVVSLDPMRELLASYRYKFGAMTVFVTLLVWGSITLFTQTLVNQPVKHLLRHTKLLSKGELNSTVPYFSTDELGELANAFNGMTLNLKKARTELEEWAKNLEAKVEERTREIQLMQNQLIRSEKLASLGELVAGIAHEINNPLTGILMFSSMIASDSRLDPSLKNDTNMIVRETKRCAKIVKGLLDFSRETPPQKKPSAINAIIEDTLALVTNQSSFHDITIIKEYRDTMPDVLVDPHQIEQVFVNILLNASHAMPHGGDLIIATGVDEPEWVYVRVTDNGCGIPPENLEKIFDPFFTTKETKGTGLGLSVSYGIIESHGGRIEVASTVNVGTTFTILLPLQIEEAAGATDSLESQLKDYYG